MTAVPEYDVFVSYAHADNEIPEGTSAQFGWVTALARNLNMGPGVLKKRLFIDHQLKPGDEFSTDLLTKLENSTLLVLLLSQNYVDSKWCGKELEHFVRTHANDAVKPADVFVVELLPFEQLDKVPSTIQNLRKRLIHAKFWHQPPDSASPRVAGYPSPKESGEAGGLHYWSMLDELKAAIDARLRARRGTRFAPCANASLPPPARADEPPLGYVLLADVTDDLESHRNAVKRALEPEGIGVLPEGDYVGLTPQEFDSAFVADLARSSLFVQLLSPTVGRKAKGFAAPLPQLQFDRASASGKQPVMQWCEQLPDSGLIAEAGHARLFETEFLRATNLARFQDEVVERLRAARKQRDASSAAAESASAATAGKRQVFVDDLASQPALSSRLRSVIKDQNCDIRSLPPAAPLGNNGIDVREVLKPCRAGLTIYTDKSKYVTAYNRLVFFLNQIAEANLAVARWGIYLEEEGDVAEVFGIESQDVVAVNEHSLADFLRGL